MTRLEAVNLILSACGLGAVANLETATKSDAASAERVLNEVELRVQKVGWNYNTRSDVEIEPDADSHIVGPTGTIWMDSDAGDAHRNLTQLGSRLYDRDNNTDEFTSSVHVRYILRYDFDCIPHPVADYIASEAAYEFARRHGRRFVEPGQLGFVISACREQRGRCRVEARRYESETANINLLDTEHVRRIKGDRLAEDVRVSDIRGTE